MKKYKFPFANNEVNNANLNIVNSSGDHASISEYSSSDEDVYFHDTLRRSMQTERITHTEEEEERSNFFNRVNIRASNFINDEALESGAEQNATSSNIENSDESLDSSDADFIDNRYIYTPQYLYLRDDIF